MVALLGAIGAYAANRAAQREITAWPVLNEVVASNPGSFKDSAGAATDWVEVHNPTAEPIDLEGWFLSDDEAEPARWRFPEVVLAPGEHLVVFASGEDRAEPSEELHTSFRIAYGDEPVLLVEPDGRTVSDRLDPAEAATYASFGRHPTERGRRCLFAFPTPGGPNAPECFDGPELGAPRFSVAPGFHSEPFELELLPAVPGQSLIYTLDGSYPDLDANPERTFPYDGPIPIEDRTGKPAELSLIETNPPDHEWVQERALRFGHPDLDGVAVEMGTVVRARSAHSATATATYFVGDEHLRADLPVVSLALDPDYLFDHSTGIYVAGEAFERWRDSDEYDPAMHGARVPANYLQRGRAWERPAPASLQSPVSFEFCAAGGDCYYRRDVGIRLHGLLSRLFPQKSLRLYARPEHGTGAFDAPLFGPGGRSGHRRILLRNSGQDTERLLFADGYLQSLMGDLRADTQAYEPAVVFVNGEYWGIYNLRERYDEHYIEVVHGAPRDAVEILESSSADPSGHLLAGNVEGVVEAWEQFLDGLVGLDRSSRDFVEAVQRSIDVDSFFDFVIANTFVANTDWYANNTRLWREPDGPDRPGEGVRDGRWRWQISDLDHMGGGGGSYDLDYDSFDGPVAPTDDPRRHHGYAFLFTAIVGNPELRERFVVRFADHLNASFAPERTLAELERLRSRLAPEIPRHAARWQIWSADLWEPRVLALAEFMERRPDAQRRQLRERFDLGAPVQVRVRHDPQAGAVGINTLSLDAGAPGVGAPGDWEGTYFRGMAVTLRAQPRDGHRFAGWRGLPEGTAGDVEVEVVLDSDLAVEALFEPAR